VTCRHSIPFLLAAAANSAIGANGNTGSLDDVISQADVAELN
jgi:hypothetical protein